MHWSAGSPRNRAGGRWFSEFRGQQGTRGAVSTISLRSALRLGAQIWLEARERLVNATFKVNQSLKPDLARASDMASVPERSRPISISVFTGYFAEQGGGVEKTASALVEALRAEGMDIELLAVGSKSGRAEWERPLPGTDAINRRTGVPLPLPAPWALPAIWRSAARADLVVAIEANFIASALGFVCAKLWRRPTLVIQHVGKPSTVSRAAGVIMALGERFVVRPIVRAADKVVCVSPAVTNYFLGERSDILNIGHPIDTTLFRPAADVGEKGRARASLGLPLDRPTACFVGRLTESKGIAVIEHLARILPDWVFAVAGSGPTDVAAWDHANVHPLGHLEPHVVAQLYRACDAAILPSQSESFSLVVREALATGIRVVCADQILETDAALAPYVEVVPVDLSNIAGTAAICARILQGESGFAEADARAHIERECALSATHGAYLDIVRKLALARVPGR